MKWLHRIAILDSSLRIEFVCFPVKPNKLKTFIEDLETNPLHPTSFVLTHALYPFCLASSTSSKYFARFFFFQSLIFSSSGDVSSMKHAFFVDALWMHMSGRKLVAAISGGTGYCC